MIEYKGIKWTNYQGALIPVVAPHESVNLLKQDTRFLLKTSNAYFLRWIDKWDIKEKTDFWYVIKDNFEGMAELSPNTRSKIRRGMKKCIVKKVSGNTIYNNGYDVYKKAFVRYNTFLKPATKEKFENSIYECIQSNSYEFFAVYNRENDKLIAYSQNLIQSGICNYYVIKFDPEYLRLYPAYCLFYEMNKHYLNECNMSYVSDGARSISHQTNIQTFLIDKFRFRKAYCRLNIIYTPRVNFLVKIMFPAQRIISKINHNAFKKLSVLLKQEAIRRKFAN